MNRYFEDTGYHLYQAGKNARKGLEATQSAAADRVRRTVGREPEPEPSPLVAVAEEIEQLRSEVLEASERIRAR